MIIKEEMISAQLQQLKGKSGEKSKEGKEREKEKENRKEKEGKPL